MIILMGMTGAGKGTQAQMLVEKGYSHISSGELFRAYATDEQRERLMRGELMRDDELFNIVEKALATVPDLEKCILDGVVRSIPQADWLLDQVAKGRFKITAIIHIAVSEDVIKKRLMARGRSDDTEASIAKRIEEYHKNTEPILEYLEAKGIKVCHIDGDQTPEAVHQDILRCLD